jgi:predicted acetyltransferase
VDDPLLELVRDRYCQLELEDRWMLRVVSVAEALGGRGYPPDLKASLDLLVHDDLVAKNRGRWRITVSSGEAKVSKAGRGALELDVRALAALYSGHATAEQLARRGQATASARTLARATCMFAGGRPALPDHF